MADNNSKNDSSVLQEVKYVPTKNGEFIPGPSERKPDTLFLYFTVFAATLMVFGGGTALTWSSPVIPKLLSNDTSVNPLIEPATTVQISMMMGLPGLTSLCGTLIAPLISDLIGRKRSLQFSTVFMILCDIVIAFSNRITYIIIARCVFMAFFMGGSSIFIIYLLEICENHNRGKFGCFVTIFLPFGGLYSYLFGPSLSVMMFTLVTSAPLLISLLLLLFINESPVFLLSNERKEECLKALQKLRSNKSTKEIKEDFEEIEYSLNQRLSSKNATIFSLFKTKQGRVGILLAMIPSLLQCASGAPILLAFLGPIFNTADTGLSGNNVAIIVGIIKVLSFTVTTIIIERFARRTLLILSSIGCGLSLFIVAFYFYLQYIKSPILSSIKFLPLISIVCYFISISVGLGPIPPTICGELFTSEFRSIAVSIMMTVSGILLFFTTSGFPLIAEYAGLHWGFLLFSINSFIGAIALYILLIETRGKSILEIQEELKSYKFSFKPPVRQK